MRNCARRCGLELKDIHRSIGVTAVYVTHDQAEAMSLSDTIVVMGEGEILQVGSPRALYEEPADVRVARFIGRANIFDAVVVDGRKPVGPGPNRRDREHLRLPHVRQTPHRTRAAPSRSGPKRYPSSGRSARWAAFAAASARSSISATSCSTRSSSAAGAGSKSSRSSADQLEVGDEIVVEIDPERCYFIAGAADRTAS